MLTEISYACGFLVRHIPTPHPVSTDTATLFHDALAVLLTEKLEKLSWDINYPLKGCASRSLMCLGGKVDPVIREAAQSVGLHDVDLFFPMDLVLWIDPNSVSYRTGNDHTPIILIWEDRSAALAAVASLPSARTKAVIIRNPGSKASTPQNSPPKGNVGMPLSSHSKKPSHSNSNSNSSSSSSSSINSSSKGLATADSLSSILVN